MKNIKLCNLLGGLILLSFSAVQTATATVVAPGSTVAGKTLAEWSAEWWKWALSFPASGNPLLDDTGAFAHLGDIDPDVFFLGGAFGTGVERTFSVPSGKFIFFPLINTVFIPDPGDTLADALAAVDAEIDTVTELHASIDGVPIPDLFDHRETTTSGFDFTVTDDSLLADFGFPTGLYSPAASDGYWLMLEPGTLSRGEEHVINFGGSFPGFGVDVTDRITIPEPSVAALMAIGGLAFFGARSRSKTQAA